MKKTCIIIAGPTAVGKTAVAVGIAGYFSTSIISADSRQCYKELNIGTAKPSAAELQAVHHYFINTHSVTEDLSAADYELYALNAVTEIFAANDIAIISGGTGLYIKAFCEGLDDIPVVEESVMQYINNGYKLHGLGFLQEEIQKADPVFYDTGDMNNPHRIIRALSVVLSSGRSITTYQTREKKERDFNIIKIGLELPREILYERINTRVDDMIEQGLAAEVKELIPYKKKNALQTVAYRELFDYFDDKLSMPAAIELIKQHTRQYAKRQLTWFKKDSEMIWCAPEMEEVLKIVKDFH